MDESNQFMQSLALLAPTMSRLPKSESAQVRYELLSGSLIWSDEIPTDCFVDKDCLRFVLKYRTGLLIGETDPSCVSYWQEALRLFPDWIGFLPERRTFDQKLADFYHNERQRVFKALGEVESD